MIRSILVESLVFRDLYQWKLQCHQEAICRCTEWKHCNKTLVSRGLFGLYVFCEIKENEREKERRRESDRERDREKEREEERMRESERKRERER